MFDTSKLNNFSALVNRVPEKRLKMIYVKYGFDNLMAIISQVSDKAKKDSFKFYYNDFNNLDSDELAMMKEFEKDNLI